MPTTTFANRLFHCYKWLLAIIKSRGWSSISLEFFWFLSTAFNCLWLPLPSTAFNCLWLHLPSTAIDCLQQATTCLSVHLDQKQSFLIAIIPFSSSFDWTSLQLTGATRWPRWPANRPVPNKAAGYVEVIKVGYKREAFNWMLSFAVLIFVSYHQLLQLLLLWKRVNLVKWEQILVKFLTSSTNQSLNFKFFEQVAIHKL